MLLLCPVLAHLLEGRALQNLQIVKQLLPVFGVLRFPV